MASIAAVRASETGGKASEAVGSVLEAVGSQKQLVGLQRQLEVVQGQLEGPSQSPGSIEVSSGFTYSFSGPSQGLLGATETLPDFFMNYTGLPIPLTPSPPPLKTFQPFLNHAVNTLDLEPFKPFYNQSSSCPIELLPKNKYHSQTSMIIMELMVFPLVLPESIGHCHGTLLKPCHTYQQLAHPTTGINDAKNFLGRGVS